MYNFLNFPAVRFKKASIKNRDEFYNLINDKFNLEEKRGTQWAEDCWNALGENDNEKLDALEKERGKIHIIDEFIDILIDNYTLAESNLDFEEVREIILRSKYIKNIEFKQNPKQIVFETNIGTFKASKLSDIFPDFQKFPNIENRGRHKRCHPDSLAVSHVLGNKHKVATGYNATFGEGKKFLHSWVELTLDGRPFVIDTTRNLLMPRKGYYFIRNINGPVYKISGETLQKERPIFEKLWDENAWLIKLYLSNRHQAIQLYKQIAAEEEQKRNEDPLYVAAKNMAKGFEKFEKNFQKEQKNSYKQNGE